jgi:uncharacterized surface protein with fasciclin (FAS1) repeats
VPDGGTPSDILRENPDQFGTFWQWVVDAGLDDDLDDEGDAFTIFAPTNDAIGDFEPPSDQDELADLVLQYVVEDVLDTATVFDGDHDELEAMQGSISVDATDRTVGGATIVFPDLEAEGDPTGFVHGIDQLFEP